jgi:hypothetical protein
MITKPNTTVGTCANKPTTLLLSETLYGRRMSLGAAYRIRRRLIDQSS